MSCVVNSQNRSFVLPRHEKQNTEESFSVHTFDHLLTADEISYLLDLPSDFERSRVLLDDGSEVLDSGRTSYTSFVPKSVDAVVECIEHKLSQAAGEPHENMEGLQLTRYDRRQRYDAHHDAFDEDAGTQRTTTIFTHLQGVDTPGCGGATVFPNTTNEKQREVRVESRTGVSVKFANITSSGEVEPLSLHAGERLTCPNIRKVGLNAWWQDRPYDE